VIEVGHVGVVISYTGNDTADTSGDDYRHGEACRARIARGVERAAAARQICVQYLCRQDPDGADHQLHPEVESDIIGQHKFDENLSEVSLITRDAFEPTLPLSVVVHIDYRKAPLVVQRFGDIKKLVEQTLDPMVSPISRTSPRRRR
jgi:hypothetical protein